MYVQYAVGVPFGAKYCNWGWGWKSSFFEGRQGGLRELGTFFSSWLGFLNGLASRARRDSKLVSQVILTYFTQFSWSRETL